MITMQGQCEQQSLQTGSTSSSVALTPVGADVIPSSVFADVLSVSIDKYDVVYSYIQL